jgi:hypothetical protein
VFKFSPKTTIHLESGKDVIISKNASDGREYLYSTKVEPKYETYPMIL